MSNILRNKHGNISKVKYFLPAYRNPQEDLALKQLSKQNYPMKSVTNHKQNSPNKYQNSSTHQNNDISFEIVGIHENTNTIQKQNVFHNGPRLNKQKSKKIVSQQNKHKSQEKYVQASLSSVRGIINSTHWSVPEGTQKQQFYKFVSQLKDDQTYQHTVTMFTIMYFYEQKKKLKNGN